MSYNMMTFV